jgi:hypothetical protein
MCKKEQSWNMMGATALDGVEEICDLPRLNIELAVLEAHSMQAKFKG